MTTTPERPHVVPDATGFAERLAAAAQDVREADAYREDTHRRRNALIIEAVDSGVLSQRQAAKVAGIAQSRVIKLLSRSQDDLEELTD